MNIGVSLPWPFISGMFTDEGSTALKNQNHTIDSFLAALKKKGVSSIEFRHWQEEILPEAGKGFKTVSDAGFQITIHGEVEENYDTLSIMESMPWLSSYLENGSQPDGKPLVITMHPVKTMGKSIEENYKKSVSILKHLCKEIEERKLPIVIAYENQREKGFPDPAVDYKDLVSAVKETGSSSIGLCWDMGHAYSNFGRSLIAEYPAPEFIKGAVHTHIHDLYPGTDATHWPLTCGTIPVFNNVKLLKESGYQGLYNLELSPERFKGQNILEAFNASIDILADAYSRA
ncbi:MAG: TIM barrel protein [Spirochaetia bacterium]|nr:TIM barrel protein [Spirochaetia bacterium]